jgi:hypothetical protein
MTECKDYMVSDLNWDQLYDEVLKGNVSRDEFLDYLLMTTKDSYNEGFDDGCYSFSFDTDNGDE